MQECIYTVLFLPKFQLDCCIMAPLRGEKPPHNFSISRNFQLWGLLYQGQIWHARVDPWYILPYQILLQSVFTIIDKCLAVAEMGNCLATIDMGRKEGVTAVAIRGGELGPHLIQCGLGRGLPPYQVAS